MKDLLVAVLFLLGPVYVQAEQIVSNNNYSVEACEFDVITTDIGKLAKAPSTGHPVFIKIRYTGQVEDNSLLIQTLDGVVLLVKDDVSPGESIRFPIDQEGTYSVIGIYDDTSIEFVVFDGLLLVEAQRFIRFAEGILDEVLLEETIRFSDVLYVMLDVAHASVEEGEVSYAARVLSMIKVRLFWENNAGRLSDRSKEALDDRINKALILLEDL